MKQISIPVPARKVDVPLRGSILTDVPADTVPVDVSVIISVLPQVPVQMLISYLEAKGYDVEKRADA